MKILIADDEYLVTESMNHIIKQNIKDVSLVVTAKSGREAIEKAMEYKPDIIFMDIQMPGIDGIEAIRQIKATNSEAMFVIITAYEFFNYARSAVNLGVYEYLLKPLNKNKVLEAINNISGLIQIRREAIQREIQLREKINKIIPHLEGQFIHSLLHNAALTSDVEFYEEAFGMKLNYGYVVMALLEDGENSSKAESIRLSLMRQKFYKVFKHEMKNLAACLIGPPMLDRMVAYIPVEKSHSVYELRNMSITLAGQIRERMDKAVKIPYKIGLGRCYDIFNSGKSCNESYVAASIAGRETISHYEDLVNSADSKEEYPINKEKMLIQKMLLQDRQGIIDVFAEIFLWLTVTYGEDLEKIKSRLIELLFGLKRSIPLGEEIKVGLEDGFVSKILRLHKSFEIKAAYLNYLLSLLADLEKDREYELNSLAAKVLKFINANYHKDISLDDAAKETNLSYHYFSKFFKEAMGKSFIDYLTELRIEKAKELLQKTDISIKEICYQTGYGNPNYFCKLFKKEMGMTPTEYRESIYR